MNSGRRQRILTVIAIALTFASGAADVASFTRLGNVFASVMTGNIVLWGLAVARGSATLAFHTTVTAADVYREGITEVTAADIARALGDERAAKLLDR